MSRYVFTLVGDGLPAEAENIELLDDEAAQSMAVLALSDALRHAREPRWPKREWSLTVTDGQARTVCRLSLKGWVPSG